VERPPGRTFPARRLRAPLSAAALARLNRLLDELEAVFAAALKRNIATGRTGGEMVSLTFVLTPAARKMERRSSP
jgi:hypothetical protein